MKVKVKLKSGTVRRILARKNMSQNWLAKRIGTSSGYMSQMLTGARNPSPRMRGRILDVLRDSQFDDLFVLRRR